MAGLKAPTLHDLRALRTRTNALRRTYARCFRDLRNSVFAHGETSDSSEIGALFAAADAEVLRKLVAGLLELHDELWQWFWNGMPAVRRRARHSVQPSRNLDAWRAITTTRPHERIMLQAEEVIRAACGRTRG